MSTDGHGESLAAVSRPGGHAHEYRVVISWSGSTGQGYEFYDRTHRVEFPHQVSVGADGGMMLSSDAAFRGDPALTNPEEMLVAAAASCHLLSFLAVAARARLDVVSYRDEAVGLMPDGAQPMSVTSIILQPHVELAVAPGASEPTAERLAHLHDVAHRECFIANSLRSDVSVAPSYAIRG